MIAMRKSLTFIRFPHTAIVAVCDKGDICDKSLTNLVFIRLDDCGHVTVDPAINDGTPRLKRLHYLGRWRRAVNTPLLIYGDRSMPHYRDNFVMRCFGRRMHRHISNDLSRDEWPQQP
jgi:hypothetical protein